MFERKSNFLNPEIDSTLILQEAEATNIVALVLDAKTLKNLSATNLTMNRNIRFNNALGGTGG